jgi:hypothetical protein
MVVGIRLEAKLDRALGGLPDLLTVPAVESDFLRPPRVCRPLVASAAGETGAGHQRHPEQPGSKKSSHRP